LAAYYPRCFEPALLLGLDIHHSAIRMVELSQRADGRLQLERCGQRALPADAVADEHIRHPGQLAEHIGALTRQLATRRKRVALALPAHAVATRQMQVPADLSETALNELIAAEASRYLALAPDDVRLDYQFCRSLSEDPAREIVLAAARREQVEDRIAAVEAAGLIPVVLDIDLCAAHAACVYGAAEPAPSALLMVDASSSAIALFDRHRLCCHRALPGCDAATALAQMAVAAARAIRLATPAGMALERIFIGGDGAQGPLAQALQEQAGTSCLVAHPFAAMAAGRRLDAETTAAAQAADASGVAPYLVACGLAMRRAP
jgi:type IV pilus assembly protein PilM